MSRIHSVCRRREGAVTGKKSFRCFIRRRKADKYRFYCIFSSLYCVLPVRGGRNDVSRLGNIISAAPDRQNAIQAAENAVKTVLIRLTAPDEETEAFLSSNSPFPPLAYPVDPAQLEESANPAFLESDLLDYAGRNPRETLNIVQKLTGLDLCNAAINGKEPQFGREFWKAFIRGGYQGAIYYIDKQFCRS
jgi:hypothetical protein